MSSASLSFGNIKLTCIFSLICLFFSFYGYAQSSKETYQDGEDFFEAEDYKEAIYYLLQVEQKGNKSANLKYKIGVCYLNIPGEEAKAIPYLEEAVKHIAVKYKAKDIEERQAPLHSLFYLGNAYRIDNQLGKALEAYDKFVKSPGYEGNYNIGIVDKEIAACERAKIIQDGPIDISWFNLGGFINTPSSETHAVISGDETVIIFLRNLKFYDAVFMSKKEGDNWLPAENISPQILSDGDYYPTAISFDGKELYLIKKVPSLDILKTSVTNSDIYVSIFADGKWSAAKPLNSNVNSPKDEIAATISADGKILYFSSDRRGSRGGFDLYRSVRGANNEWGKAENLGKPVNTREDETTPSISPDGKTLYFSSKGHYNMGGYDIFYSTLQKDGTWSIPVNLGYPINTTNYNIGYQTFKDGKTGYISRISSDGGYGKEDIYKVEIRSAFIQKYYLEEK